MGALPLTSGCVRFRSVPELWRTWCWQMQRDFPAHMMNLHGLASHHLHSFLYQLSQGSRVVPAVPALQHISPSSLSQDSHLSASLFQRLVSFVTAEMKNKVLSHQVTITKMSFVPEKINSVLPIAWWVSFSPMVCQGQQKFCMLMPPLSHPLAKFPLSVSCCITLQPVCPR